MPTIETFSWCPDPGASVTETERQVRASFGDGYTQTVGDGINTLRDDWSVTFTRDNVIVEEIRDFIRRHKQRTPFYWTPPGSTVPALYVASDPAITYNGGSSATLKFKISRTYRGRP